MVLSCRKTPPVDLCPFISPVYTYAKPYLYNAHAF